MYFLKREQLATTMMSSCEQSWAMTQPSLSFLALQTPSSFAEIVAYFFYYQSWKTIQLNQINDWSSFISSQSILDIYLGKILRQSIASDFKNLIIRGYFLFSYLCIIIFLYRWKTVNRYTVFGTRIFSINFVSKKLKEILYQNIVKRYLYR